MEKKNRSNLKLIYGSETFTPLPPSPPPPRGVYSLRIVVIKDHLTGEETGAMENNEIFVGKEERGEGKEGVIEKNRSRQRT